MDNWEGGGTNSIHCIRVHRYLKQSISKEINIMQNTNMNIRPPPINYRRWLSATEIILDDQPTSKKVIVNGIAFF